MTLGGENHGGVTVMLTSSDDSKLRLAANGTTAGSGTLNVPFAAGETQKDIYAQAVRNAAPGDVTVTATQAAFTTGTATVTVVQPVFQIYGLPATTTTLAADDEFYVQAGILTVAGTSILAWQVVSAEGPLPVMGVAARCQEYSRGWNLDMKDAEALATGGIGEAIVKADEF